MNTVFPLKNFERIPILVRSAFSYLIPLRMQLTIIALIQHRCNRKIWSFPQVTSTAGRKPPFCLAAYLRYLLISTPGISYSLATLTVHQVSWPFLDLVTMAFFHFLPMHAMVSMPRALPSCILNVVRQLWYSSTRLVLFRMASQLSS